MADGSEPPGRRTRRSGVPLLLPSLLARIALTIVLSAGFVVVGGSPAQATTRPSRTPAAVATPRVVLILVERFDWSTAPPVLSSFSRGSMSLRTVGDGRVDVDGFLTIGKGRRSAGMAGVDGVGTTTPTADGSGFTVDRWADFVDEDEDLRFGGALGEFGEALNASGKHWQLVTDDPAAIGAVADRGGVATHASITTTAQLPDALGRSVSAGTEVTIVGLSSHERLEELIGRAGASCVVVSSVSYPDVGPHLGVFAMSPLCGRGVGGLVSTSTKQPPFLMLVDIAPTTLDVVGVELPESFQGHPARSAPAHTVTDLIREDHRAGIVDHLRGPFGTFLVIAFTASAAVVLWKRRIPLLLATTLAFLPVASFVMMVVPWWRHGLAGAIVVSGGIAFVAAAAVVMGTRRDPSLALAIAGGLTALILVLDGATGGHLQLDAPLGNSPLIAGRFAGIGNIAFGLALAGILVATAITLRRWGSSALPWVLVAATAAVILDGAPSLGNDVGGILASIPAIGALIISHGSGRLPLRRAALLAAIAGVALVVFAAIDLNQPSDAQTHLARWLSSGDRFDTIVRKAESAGRTFQDSKLRLLLPLPLVALFVRRRRLLDQPWLRSLSIALVVGAVLGTLLNDSGVEVAAAMMTIAFPVLAWFSAGSISAGIRSADGDPTFDRDAAPGSTPR